jgi:hypothetical protein
MDYMLPLKAGFMGFSVSLGVQLLGFYLLGTLLGLEKRSFIKAFTLVAVVSFLAVYVLLHYKTQDYQAAHALLFLAGCVGGWLGGIFSGLTSLRGTLMRLLR